MSNWLDMYNAEEDASMYKQGGLIKRADGSYSKRGLWDNIRANKGSGRKPTAEMLRQERKIKKHDEGSFVEGDEPLPKGFLTYQSNADYFDNHAVYHDNAKYNDQIRKMVYSGKAAYNPTTGELRFINSTPADAATQQMATEDYTRGVRKNPTNTQYAGADKRTKQIIQNTTESAFENPLMYAPGTIGLGMLPTTFGMGYGFSQAGINALQGNYKDAAITAGLSALPFIPHTYKINPWAFKPNPEAYYRGIGKTGLDDAIKSKYIRGNPEARFRDQVFLSDNIKEAELFSKGYIAEIPKSKITEYGSTPMSRSRKDIFISENPISLDDAKLYKQDWLRGYKEVSKKEDGGWIDMYNEGSWVEDSSLPTPTTPSFYDAYPDRTLTNYQMGTDKAPMYGAGSTVWTNQDTPLYAAGTPTPTATQNFRNDRSLNTDLYRIGDVIPTGMNYKTPSAGTHDYNQDVQPPKKMVIHAPDTLRIGNVQTAKHGGHIKKHINSPRVYGNSVNPSGMSEGPTTQRGGMMYGDGSTVKKGKAKTQPSPVKSVFSPVPTKLPSGYKSWEDWYKKNPENPTFTVNPASTILYNIINPAAGDNYSPIQAFKNILNSAGYLKPNNNNFIDDAFFGKYMGVPYNNNFVENSPYKPTTSTEDKSYSRLNRKYINSQGIIDSYFNSGGKDTTGYQLPGNVYNTKNAKFLEEKHESPYQEKTTMVDPFARVKLSKGQDEQGSYISLYDKYDLKSNFVEGLIGQPYEIYDRFYFNPKTNKSVRPNTKYKKEGGYIQNNNPNTWLDQYN